MFMAMVSVFQQYLFRKKTKCQLFLYKLVQFSIKYIAMYVNINTIHIHSKRL